MVIDQFTKSLECYPIPNQTVDWLSDFPPEHQKVSRQSGLSVWRCTHSSCKKLYVFVPSILVSFYEAHGVARDNLKSAQERQKKDYDLRASRKAYYVGDAVYKLDSATKIGQSRSETINTISTSVWKIIKICSLIFQNSRTILSDSSFLFQTVVRNP
jgi:hypothetical protein